MFLAVGPWNGTSKVPGNSRALGVNMHSLAGNRSPAAKRCSAVSCEQNSHFVHKNKYALLLSASSV